MDLLYANMSTFIVTYIIIYCGYYLFAVRKAEKNKQEKKIAVEIQYLILRYNIDISKLNYRKFLNRVALIGALDIALVVMVISNLNGMIIPLIVGFGLLIPIIIITFMLLGKYYVKKGMIKDVK